MKILKFLFDKWKAFSLLFGNFMSGVLLTVFYIVVVTPYALGIKFFSDPLVLKKKASWQPKKMNSRNLEEAHRQY